MDIFLFGALRIMLDGEPFRLRAAPSTAQVLAYLLLCARSPQSRRAVAFALWPDDTESEATAKLRRHIYNITKALPPSDEPWLLMEEGSIQWNHRAPVRIDLVEFEHLASDPSSHEQACELYGGDLLENVHADWLVPLRARYRDLFMSIAERLLEGAESERGHQAILRYGSAILRVDPCREDVVRKIMRARFRAGDRAGALQEFSRLERAVREELGVEPMDETKALRDSILAATEHPASATKPAARARHILPFVGRAHEMAQLHGVFAEALRGERNSAMVYGEPGVGKSFLVAEFCRDAERDATILVGHCALDGGPFDPLAQMLEGCAEKLMHTSIERRWLAILAVLVPQLHSFVEAIDVELPDTADKTSRLFEAIAQAFRALSSVRPLAVVLEDVHLASPTICAALSFLVDRLRGVPVLVVATYRDDEANRTPAMMSLRRALTEQRTLLLDVPRLTAREVDDLVARAQVSDDDFAERLFDLTSGNALFVAQVLQHRLESKGEFQVAQLATVAKTIDTRFAGMAPNTVALAEGASVVGDAFEVALLRNLTRWDSTRIYDALSELLDHHIIEERNARRGMRYAFIHQIVRARLYERLSQEARAVRHHRIGCILECDPDVVEYEPARIAEHFAQAGEGPRASSYFSRAAQRAIDFGAAEEAIAFAARGLELCDGPGIRYALLNAQERGFSRVGDREKQAEALSAMQAIAIVESREDWRVETLTRQIVLNRLTGQKEVERGLVEDMLLFTRERGDELFEAQALKQQAHYLVTIGELERARACVQTALTTFRNRKVLEGEVEALCLLADIDAYRNLRPGDSPLEAMAERLRAENAPRHLLLHIYGTLTRTTHGTREWSVVKRFAEQHLELSVAMGDRTGEVQARQMLIGVAGETHRPEDAVAQAEVALPIVRALGNPELEAFIVHNLGLAWLNTGMYEHALPRFEHSIALCETLGNRRLDAFARLNRALCLIGLGRCHEALQDTSRAALAGKELSIPLIEGVAMATHADALLNLKRPAEAVTFAENALEVLRRLNITSETIYVDALARAMEAADRCGEAERAREYARELAALLVDADIAGPMASDVWRLARFWRRRGNEELAHAYAETAAKTMVGHHAKLPREVVERNRAGDDLRDLVAWMEHGTWPPEAEGADAWRTP